MWQTIRQNFTDIEVWLKPLGEAINPSWLQAFAALVALGIAVWSTLRTDRAARRRQQLQARCIATAIFPELLEIGVDVERRKGMLTALIPVAERTVGQSFAFQVQSAQIDLPPMFSRSIDNLYLLGEHAGPTCLQLVTVILQYNTLVNMAAGQIAVMDKGESVDHIKALDGHFKAMEILLAEARTQLAVLHDPKTRFGWIRSMWGKHK